MKFSDINFFIRAVSGVPQVLIIDQGTEFNMAAQMAVNSGIGLYFRIQRKFSGV